MYFPNIQELRDFFIKIKNSTLFESRVTSWTENSQSASNFLYGSGYSFYTNDVDNEAGFGLKISTIVSNDKIICSCKKVYD